MRLGRLAFCLAFLTVSFRALAFSQTIVSPAVGDIALECNDPGAWNISASLRTDDGIEYLDIDLEAPQAAIPPVFSVRFFFPQKDVQHLWTAVESDRCQLKPDWSGNMNSLLAYSMPIYEFYSESGTNRLTVACDESFRFVRAGMGIREENSMLAGSLEFFLSPEAPLRSYQTTVRLDSRPLFWADTIREASEWISTAASLEPCRVPEAAFEPLYSSWYQFHQDVHAADIEAECELASSMGMKTIILDDGWQTGDGNRGYRYCGDWEVCADKFADMAAHVEAVHMMGMKYMMWYSVPFIGLSSKNYARFQGKYLYTDNGLGAAVLDPRFPEVREWLVSLYSDAVSSWKLDGLKLDFIDNFHTWNGDPAVAENYAGRDIKSVPEAVNVLMKSITEALHGINPDILLEFRQPYVGPAIRQYGNMLRASDCPGDLPANRMRIANLRLTSGNTAVHSDMLEWNSAESAADAARNIISSMFGVVQYSVMLRDIPSEHVQMISHWMGFLDAHRETLLRSEFRPYRPEAAYPLIEARSEKESIVAVYQDGVVAPLEGASRGHVFYVVNGACADSVAVALSDGTSAVKPRYILIYDALGNCRRYSLRGRVPSLCSIPIPHGGYAELGF